MRLLLLKDIFRVGNLGDVVEVNNGYARNYLLPQRLATEPTEENIRAIEEDRKKAAADRARRRKVFEDLVEKMRDVAVKIEATANPEGTLYGSVGAKEITDALHAQGFEVLAEHIQLDAPIRTLDNYTVTLRFAEGVSTDIQVEVAPQGGAAHGGEAGERREASAAERGEADD